MRRVDDLALCGRGRPFHSGVSDPDRLFAQQLEEHLGNCAKWAGTTRAPPPPPVAVAGSPRPCARYGPSPSRRAVTSTYGIGCWNKPAGAGQAIHAQRHQPPAAPGGGDRRPAAGSDHQEPTPAAHRPRTHHYASSGAEPPVRAHPRRRPRTPAATAARRSPARFAAAGGRNQRRTAPSAPLPGSSPLSHPDDVRPRRGPRSGHGDPADPQAGTGPGRRAPFPCKGEHPMQLTSLGKKVVAAAAPYTDQSGDLHGPRHKPKALVSPELRWPAGMSNGESGRFLLRGPRGIWIMEGGVLRPCRGARSRADGRTRRRVRPGGRGCGTSWGRPRGPSPSRRRESSPRGRSRGRA
ncbi:hypothetical protein QFZ24_000387 [Streptomyces phaeochromogenes]|nr:hypothetical protein [Streptomyces phaeochromogenes]